MLAKQKWRLKPRSTFGAVTCFGALALAVPACVDDEIQGVSTELLVLEGSEAALAPGSKTELVFQAVDANQAGVADQRIEVVLTDPARLGFEDDPTSNRHVLSTEKKAKANGVEIAGAVVVDLKVPADAKPGTAAVVASLEGGRSDGTKTRLVSFEIGAATGEAAGAGGMGAENAGAGGSGGAAAGGAPGSGGASGAGAANGEGGAAGHA